MIYAFQRGSLFWFSCSAYPSDNKLSRLSLIVLSNEPPQLSMVIEKKSLIESFEIA